MCNKLKDMPYNINEILELPPKEKIAIVEAILNTLDDNQDLQESNELSTEQSQKLDNRFAKVESGNYVSYSIDEVKHKLNERWQRK